MSTSKVWVARDYLNCSGCRRCEVACSLWHEKKIWPEASRVRVFMLTPTLEIPHLCAQCDDAPCINSCPENALSRSDKTGAILVDAQKCISCGKCVNACPGRVPFLHPATNKATICDLCDGQPECARVCQEGRYNALWKAPGTPSISYKLYAKTPAQILPELAARVYRDLGKELI